MRALVIGLGHMGKFHHQALCDLGYDVTTVDPDPAVGADYLRTPWGGHFEVVCIACPIKHLAECAAQYASWGGPVLIEKPGAATANEARLLAMEYAGRQVAVGYIERFNPVVRELRRNLLQATRNSPPELEVNATFRRYSNRPSPDVYVDLMSHGLDLANWMQLSAKHECETEWQRKIRTITINLENNGSGTEPQTLHADLTAHPWSPIHAEWHWFLSGRGWNATLANAASVLSDLEALKNLKGVYV
jgi:predicted dehydrogenase